MHRLKLLEVSNLTIADLAPTQKVVSFVADADVKEVSKDLTIENAKVVVGAGRGVGTQDGITAIQMDIKIDGLTYEIIAVAFEKCRKGRLFILDEIIKPVIAEPRHELSRWAPKMFSMMIPTDKIKDVIGKGGKVIQDICDTCNCKIDVQEDGHVFVSAVDQEDAKRAIFTIRTIVEDPEIGAIYKGKVTRLMNFGAFVEIAPGKEGLVHISKLDTKRVERVEDVVAVGDAIVVKVTDIDQQGRINLSRRDAILALEAKKAQQEQG